MNPGSAETYPQPKTIIRLLSKKDCRFPKIPLFSKKLPNIDGEGIVMSNSEIFTIRELATFLKLAEKTAYRLAADGKLPGFKVGGAWRFRREEIECWIRAQEQKTAGIAV